MSLPERPRKVRAGGYDVKGALPRDTRVEQRIRKMERAAPPPVVRKIDKGKP
jgi:hypothetical protein